MRLRQQLVYVLGGTAVSLLFGAAATCGLQRMAEPDVSAHGVSHLVVLLIAGLGGSFASVWLMVRFVLSRQYEVNRKLRQAVADSKQVEADLTSARKKAEAASHSKSEFLANMSHEIRTPMTAILGFTDLLLESRKMSPEALRELYIIRRNGEHLLDILNDILDLSKIEANRLDVEKATFSPCMVLYDVQSLMQARAIQNQLDFNIEFIGLVPETIQSDPLRFRQILINLVGNAIKFTEYGGVRVVTRLLRETGSDSKLQIDVIDTGIGIAPERLGNIFEPFTQGDASAVQRFGGTGLGLSISQRLARKLGGNIEVISEVEQGSTFRLTIATGPLEGVRLIETDADLRSPFHPPEPSLETRSAPLQGRVLLAEDCQDNRRLIEFILARWGLSIDTADNGQEALEEALAAQAAGQPYDVILMDVQMPVMDGYEAVRLLRAQDYHRPIVALTAHAMASDREQYLRCGCDDFATKPINRAQLRSILERFTAPESQLAEPLASSV